MALSVQVRKPSFDDIANMIRTNAATKSTLQLSVSIVRDVVAFVAACESVLVGRNVTFREDKHRWSYVQSARSMASIFITPTSVALELSELNTRLRSSHPDSLQNNKAEDDLLQLAASTVVTMGFHASELLRGKHFRGQRLSKIGLTISALSLTSDVSTAWDITRELHRRKQLSTLQERAREIA